MEQKDILQLDQPLQQKINALREYFTGKTVVVAYSGGVDSTVIAELAFRFAKRMIAVTANSPTVFPGEIEEAIKIAKLKGWEHRIIKVNEIEDEDFRRNPPNRCYFCKKFLSKTLQKIAFEVHADIIVEGTNYTEVTGHRPGLKALRENKIDSPLLEKTITKPEIRKIAHFLKLPNADKPSLACLSSRFPYGEQITIEKLRRVGNAELFIMNKYDIQVIRVRDHGGLARIEVGPNERIKILNPETLDDISSKLKSLGFTYVTLDCQGYRTGAMNEVL
ncbi:MAG: ATP-dependent sacrificial sulfur transferase LarE [Candidatus Hodarchaeales archaeon]